MLFKSFQFAVKEVQGDGVIRGYASTFGNVDQGRDVVVKGAFSRTIKNNAIIPILDSHDPTKQIGVNIAAEEDSKGLFVEGQLNMDDERARAKFSLVKLIQKNGGKAGLSIGYRIIRDDYDREKNIRFLKEVRLFEYSIVAFPMNEEASVTEAKGRADALDFQIQNMVNMGYSPEEIKSALARRLAENSNESDSGNLIDSLDAAIKKLKGI